MFSVRVRRTASARPVLLALAAAALLLLGGCAPGAGDAHGAEAGAPLDWRAGPSVAPSGNPAPPSWHIVALGDSVASGGPCGCTPFPQLYGADLARDRGVQTHTVNLGADGQTSGDLLATLRDPGSAASRAVGRADVVLVTIGANDFLDRHDDVTTGKCLGGRDTACVADDLTSMVGNVTAIVGRIHRLREGRPTAVLVTGYWNVFEDGRVARRTFPALGVRATQRLTLLANAGIRKAADTAGGTYVDLFAPFNGPQARGDTTHLLASDGDHPNAAGQALIARRLVAAGLPGLVKG
jgi:lysophospholipase L1-like esterase